MATLTPTIVLNDTQNTPQTLSLSSAVADKEDSVEVTPDQTPSDDAIAINFENCYNGIGIKVIGGATSNNPNAGIFIKRILKKGLAAQDGTLKSGDRICRVNGRALSQITYTDSLTLLREAAASGQVTLVISRDSQSQAEFTQLIEEEEITSQSELSRLSTPTNSIITSESVQSTPRTDQSDRTPLAEPSNQTASTPNKPVALNNSFRKDRENHGRPMIARLSNQLSADINSGKMSSTPHDGYKGLPRSTLPLKLSNTLNRQDQATSRITLQTPPSILVSSTSAAAAAVIDFHSKKINIDKLESALNFLGINLTHTEQSRLRSSLHIDDNNRVDYDEFVSMIQDLFPQCLDATNITLNESVIPHTSISVRPQTSRTSVNVSRVTLGANSELQSEIDNLQRENQQLRKQIHQLSKRLHEQTNLTTNKEKQLIQFRLTAQSAVDEANILREKLELATESQKLAVEQEKDYENMISNLEQEVTRLRDNEAQQMESPAVRKRLAVLGTQLRKAEESRQSYQVITSKLIDFLQYIHGVMAGDVNDGSTPQSLAAECTTTIKAVQNLLEKNPLPFGWEECADDDGKRFYLNHVTQETSWSHPLTKRIVH